MPVFESSACSAIPMTMDGLAAAPWSGQRQARRRTVGVGAACCPVGDECCVVPCGYGTVCDWLSRPGGQGLGHKHVSSALCDGHGGLGMAAVTWKAAGVRSCRSKRNGKEHGAAPNPNPNLHPLPAYLLFKHGCFSMFALLLPLGSTGELQLPFKFP